MDLNTIDQVLEKLTTIIYEENVENLKRFILIQINWSKDYVFLEHSFLKNASNETLAVNQEKSFFTIEKDAYESKEDFLKNLLNDIKKFSLLHIEVAIKVCDMELPNDNAVFETKSNNKFYDKVCEFTGLNRFRLFEVLLPKHDVEMYFFVLPETNFEKIIITSGFFNNAAVNTLYVKMTSASEKLENVSFIGKIGCTDHNVLKRLVDNIVRLLVAHLKNNEDSTQPKEDVVDLTNIIEESQDEIDESTFYEFNTSDIMEIDYPLDYYYDPEIKGLSDGWDKTVDKDKYFYAATYDLESMMKYLDNYKINNVESDEENHDGSNDLKIIECPKSDDELQIISVDSSANGECSTSTKFRSKNNRKDLAVYKPSASTRMSLNRNRVNKKIKSNLFNDEEIAKWEKATGPEDMSKLLSNMSKEYKSINNSTMENYKIPKKSYAGPSPRPSIHSNPKDSNSSRLEAQQKLGMAFFHKRIENIAPYDSPSGYRVSENNTPESVSTFIDSETFVIDDDEDDNNNTNGSQNPAKRKLLSINSTTPKIFKNRRTDYNLNDSSFSASSFNKKSFNRR